MPHPNPSILLVNKPPGITSFQALGRVKRHYGKRVGHAGTLDKFAQGLLIVLTGRLTRLNPLFMPLDKRYRAQILFGQETDTLDPEGETIAIAAIPSYRAITAAIDHFIGDIEQIPPAYSALHVDGKRASDRVRSGETVVMKSRPITVHHFVPLTYENGILEADILVSKGTYIRSLARDLGHAAGSCAHLVGLTRTEVGPYSLEEAVEINDTDALLSAATSTTDYLSRIEGMGRYTIEDKEVRPLGDGRYPESLRNKSAYPIAMAFDSGGVLRAVLDCTKERVLAQVAPYYDQEAPLATL